MTLMRTAGCVLLMTLMQGAAAAPQAEHRHIESRQSLATRLLPVSAQAKAVYRLAAAGNTATVIDAITASEADATLSQSARDYLVHESLLALSAVTPDDAARRTVERYSNMPVRTWLRLQDEHGDAVVPLYDLAAAARLTRRNWDRRAAEQSTAASLAALQWQPSMAESGPPDVATADWRSGTRKALAGAEPHVLYQYRDALLAAEQVSGQYADLLLEVAQALGDAALYWQLLLTADDAVATQAVHSARQRLETGEAAGWLLAATRRDSIASAAVLELGQLAASEPQATEYLFDLLGDVRLGASAALALARAESAGSLQRLEAVITTNADESRALRAALALRLSRSDEARQLRASLLARESVSSTLHEALR